MTHSQTQHTYNLFLCVLVGAEQVNSFHVSEVDVMAQQEDEEELADILLLTVAIQSLVYCSRHSHTQRTIREQPLSISTDFTGRWDMEMMRSDEISHVRSRGE